MVAERVHCCHRFVPQRFSIAMSYIGKPPCDEGAMLHGAAAAPCAKAAGRWTLIAAVLGSGMAFIDGTVVNVALPSIQQALSTDSSGSQWVIESYALFLASLLLVGGALGDRFGRRRIFMLGVALFSAASMACALSVTAGQLIVARAVQGIGAALLVPGSLALISAAFPQSERGRAIGTWSAFSGITAAIGPVIGGFLVEHYSWRWAFLVNLPLGVALLALCAIKVPESIGTPTRKSVDIAGAVLATAGLAGLVFALIESPSLGWTDVRVAGSAAVGVVALACFLQVEARAGTPMLPLELFRERNFAGANLLTLLLYAALGAGLFFFPLNLIQVQGYGATFAGAGLLPLIAIMFLLSRWAGKLVDTFGSRLPLIAGPAIAALGFSWFALPSIGASYWTSYFPAVCVLGIGMSVTVAPLTTTVMNSVGPDLAGTASGINNAVSRAAGLMAIAAFGILMAWAFDRRLAHELDRLQAAPEVSSLLMAQHQKLAGMAVPAGLSKDLSSDLERIIRESFVAGYRWVMLGCAALALLGSLSAWLLIKGKSNDARAPTD